MFIVIWSLTLVGLVFPSYARQNSAGGKFHHLFFMHRHWHLETLIRWRVFPVDMDSVMEMVMIQSFIRGSTDRSIRGCELFEGICAYCTHRTLSRTWRELTGIDGSWRELTGVDGRGRLMTFINPHLPPSYFHRRPWFNDLKLLHHPLRCIRNVNLRTSARTATPISGKTCRSLPNTICR
jgi:hypothetical protein